MAAGASQSVPRLCSAPGVSHLLQPLRAGHWDLHDGLALAPRHGLHHDGLARGGDELPPAHLHHQRLPLHLRTREQQSNNENPAGAAPELSCVRVGGRGTEKQALSCFKPALGSRVCYGFSKLSASLAG